MKLNQCLRLYRGLIVAIVASVLLMSEAASAQSNEAQTISDTFGIRIAIEKETPPPGQSPRVQLMMWNLTNLFVTMPGDPCAGQPTRIWIRGEHGEPPTTARERIDTERALPGDQRLMCTLNAGMPILSPAGMPFDTATHTYQLEYLYDLRASGTYTIHIDVPVKDGWLRSNTVAFQVFAAEPTPTKGSL